MSEVTTGKSVASGDAENRFGVLHRVVLEGYEVSILHYDTNILVALRNSVYSEKYLIPMHEVKFAKINIIDQVLESLEERIKGYRK